MIKRLCSTHQKPRNVALTRHTFTHKATQPHPVPQLSTEKLRKPNSLQTIMPSYWDWLSPDLQRIEGSALMMMTFITRGGKGREDKNKDRKATKSEGRCPKEGACRALMRQFRNFAKYLADLCVIWKVESGECRPLSGLFSPTTAAARSTPTFAHTRPRAARSRTSRADPRLWTGTTPSWNSSITAESRKYRARALV